MQHDSAGPGACAGEAGGASRAGPGRMIWFSAIALGLMMSVPLVQPRHTYPLTAFYGEWLAFVLGAAALLPLVFKRYTAPLAIPAVAVAALALAGVVLVHLLLVKSPYAQQPVLAFAYLLWGAGLIVIGAVLRRQIGVEALVAVLAWFVLAGGMLNALAGVLQHYEWRGPLEWAVATKLGYQVYGNLGQPNHFSAHVVLALVSLVFLHATGRLKLAVSCLCAALLLFVLSLSGSRSAWLYLLVTAAVAAVGHRGARSEQTSRAMLFFAALVPAFALAHLVADLPWLAPPTLHTTAADRIFALAGTPSERLYLWREAWAMFMNAPLLGAGWGQFAWQHFSLIGSFDGTAIAGLYNHAHNLFLHLLAETGMAGGLIAAAGSIACIRGGWRAIARPAGIWIWACMAVLGAYSMLEYPLWNAYFLGIACVAAGAGDERCIALGRARLVRAAVAVFLIACAWPSMIVIDRYHRLEGVVHGRYERATPATLERAHREMLAVRESFLLVPYVDLAYARDLSLDAQDIDRKLAFTGRVMRFAPTGMVAYRHAALLALRGDESLSLAFLRRATLAYPNMLDAFIEEFSNADTGHGEAQARFLAAMRTVARQRDAATPPAH